MFYSGSIASSFESINQNFINKLSLLSPSGMSSIALIHGITITIIIIVMTIRK